MADTKTILIVDDEPDIRELLAFEFELLDFKILEAENGKRALELAKSNHVDVVMSDIRMPGGDGVSLLKGLRAIDPFSPPVILVTGFADITIPQAFDAGADAIFMKPFGLSELVAGVKKISNFSKERIETLVTPPSSFTLQKKWDVFPGDRASGFALGRGGFYLALAAPQPKRESSITFDLDFGSGPIARLQGTGTVRWTEPNGIWIEVDSLVEDSKVAFNSYVQTRRDVSFIPLPV